MVVEFFVVQVAKMGMFASTDETVGGGAGVGLSRRWDSGVVREYSEDKIRLV